MAQNESLLNALGSKERTLSTISSAFSWFSEQLIVVPKKKKYLLFPLRIRIEKAFQDNITQELSEADTGITSVSFEEMSPAQFPGPPDYVTEIKNDLRGTDRAAVIDYVGDYYHLQLNELEEVKMSKLVARHTMDEDGELKTFNLPLSSESEGTSQYMHLLPILFALRDEEDKSVFVVDELENSLHPILTRNLVEESLVSRTPPVSKSVDFYHP